MLLDIYLNHILQFSLNFSQILAIKNLKKHIILALIIFCIVFWLYIAIASKKKAAKICYIPRNGP
jgi:hypothetical protein